MIPGVRCDFLLDLAKMTEESLSVRECSGRTSLEGYGLQFFGTHYGAHTISACGTGCKGQDTGKNGQRFFTSWADLGDLEFFCAELFFYFLFSIEGWQTPYVFSVTQLGVIMVNIEINGLLGGTAAEDGVPSVQLQVGCEVTAPLCIAQPSGEGAFSRNGYAGGSGMGRPEYAEQEKARSASGENGSIFASIPSRMIRYAPRAGPPG